MSTLEAQAKTLARSSNLVCKVSSFELCFWESWKIMNPQGQKSKRQNSKTRGNAEDSIKVTGSLVCSRAPRLSEYQNVQEYKELTYRHVFRGFRSLRGLGLWVMWWNGVSFGMRDGTLDVTWIKLWTHLHIPYVIIMKILISSKSLMKGSHFGIWVLFKHYIDEIAISIKERENVGNLFPRYRRSWFKCTTYN